MDDVLEQIGLGVATSAVTGVAVWGYQHLRAAGRDRARRRFLGLPALGRTPVRLVVGHIPGTHGRVAQFDMAAALEIGVLLRDAGATVEMQTVAEARAARTDLVEFCVGGPHSNARTEAAERRHLPGIVTPPYDPQTFAHLRLSVGPRVLRREPGRVEYVLLARICRPGRRHLFLIDGQTSVTNQAAATYLATRLTQLRRRFGDDRTFCLALRVSDPQVYGHHEIDEVADVTAEALGPPPVDPPTAPPADGA